MKVSVELDERSYDVTVAHGARHELASLISERAPDAQLAIIIMPKELARYEWSNVEPGIESRTLHVPAGESAKHLHEIERLCQELSDLGVSRRDVLVGVGGGSTTDVAGFTAAVYLRGIAVAHVATTLVAQVDAAIGGKTGVNLPSGKNLVGAFHQPIGVLCDLDALDTLPERERIGGLGEVAKCWLLAGRSADELSSTDQGEWIKTAIGVKALIVSVDEREGAQRALLNYGHTLAHALEATQWTTPGLDLLHGEAVGIGVAFAVRLGRRLGRIDDSVVEMHDDVLGRLGVPRRLPRGFDADVLIESMMRDKKAHHDLTFVLAGANGFEAVHAVPINEVRRALIEFEEES